MEGRVSALDELQGQLEVERKINQEWSEMVSDWSGSSNTVTVVTARQIVKSWQQRELGYVDQLNSLRHSKQTLNTRLETEATNNAKLEADIRHRVTRAQGEVRDWAHIAELQHQVIIKMR